MSAKSMIYRFYRRISDVLEYAFYVETTGTLTVQELEELHWLIAETYEKDQTGVIPFLKSENAVEIGPRLTIETPFSSNAVGICQSMGIRTVTRIEQTRRFLTSDTLSCEAILKAHLDRMTQQHLPNGIVTFDTGIVPEPVKVIDLIGLGRDELYRQNIANGWGMDERDEDYIFGLFVKSMNRNPTNVELMYLGNALSEHCRHHFWKGLQVIDGVTMPKTLMELVKEPLKRSREMSRLSFDCRPNTSLVAFGDNSGVIRGFTRKVILPINPGGPSQMGLQEKIIHITCTAETHCHPTLVAPFEGAETGAGGRIRDTVAVGRGGWIGIGVAGYFIGNLFIPFYEIPGELVGRDNPSKYASSLEILIKGSDGVSSYGNKIGEPLTIGFCRTFGQIVDGQRREPIKPILYSGGIGHIFDEHIYKEKPEVGMIIVRISGLAYPVGVGGGAASSMTSGQNTEELDFNSVQRGNPEEENEGNRVIRTCAELAGDNPIAVIHDQGAGGISNAFTEAMEPLGGTIDIRKVKLGDNTMSVMQIWSAEFQESYAFLVRPEKLALFKSICESERAHYEILGTITGSGKIVVEDPMTGQTPVDLNLAQVLTNMPQKTFTSTRKPKELKPLVLPEMTIGEAIEKVFKLPSVGSNGHLVHKVDRSVTGLVAQQQCCGIAQIPIADNSVNAQSHFGLTGTVSSLGENPIRMLIDEKAATHMVIGEALTNMASVAIRDPRDIRCRANWIWPGKMPHQGPRLYDATESMSGFMTELGTGGLEIVPDGGKDSLTPVATTINGEDAISPGSLVILAYAPVPNITKKVTPDIKRPGQSLLGLIDLGLGKNRLGGSALAQACGQLGNESPDITAKLLRNAWFAVQQMISEGLILSLHDRSDGGLITTVAEMCMASRCGFRINISSTDAKGALPELFCEELGFVIELRQEDERVIRVICNQLEVPFSVIGFPTDDRICEIVPYTAGAVFESTITELRSWWESTSYQLDRLQINSECADSEHRQHRCKFPTINQDSSYRLSFTPKDTAPEILEASGNPRVAIIRDEGTNGDREMNAACLAAGLEPWDVAMSHLIDQKISLDQFQGIIFAGGFANMDVFGSAKGWAGTILFNPTLREMFDRFYAREDTFSLGVCNGCQLTALLGWVPWRRMEGEQQPRFIGNVSSRFESRWVQVEVLSSPSILFTGMEGSRLGVWIDHGEGRAFFPDKTVRDKVMADKLVPLAFLDPYGNRTETYPYNPNGSPEGITALCTPDGRHTAMMPHGVERSFRLWQWSWKPASWDKLEASPWLRTLQNARTWCLAHRS